MNLLVTLDSNYVYPLCVMLRSLVRTHPRVSFDVYVAYAHLTDSDFKTIGDALEGSGSRVMGIRVPDTLFDGAPHSKRLTKAAYYRLFASEYLPKTVDRVLYIDPDTYFLKDISDFYNIDFGDAFYASEYFPWSSYLTGEQGVAPGYDPLSTAIRAAHDAGLQLHAWINPYRVSYQTDIQSLYATNPARLMAENGQQMDLLQTESGIYYNPASLAAQQLILNGIREILERYDVDGIHIDDYFYPDDVGDSDAPSYMEYTKGGGTLSLNEWRTANVSALVSGIYSAVKAIDPQILFGISPSGMIDKNKTTYYADVATWGSVKGYCDYLLPQIYFGFAHEEYPFVELLDQWSDLCSLDSVKLYIGLALYKTGGTDVYAGGESAQNEWIDNTNLITRQVQALRQNKRCSGFALFSFGDLFSNDTHKQQEIQRLLQALDGEG